MPKEPKNIIIIKKKGHGGHGHHGGSWKVAYADFVTAMMAFFLLMWLLNMAKPEQKEGLAQYFREFSLFEHRGSFVIAGDKDKSDAKGAVEGSMAARIGHDMKVDPATAQQREKLSEQIRENVEEQLPTDKNRVVVEQFEDGLRIQIVDDLGKPYFDPGQVGLTTDGVKALEAVAKAIRYVPNKLAIEGHTDGSPSGKVDNWDLSSARANQARNVLARMGFDMNRLVRVSGYANAAPYAPADPLDPRNRRISILVYDTASPIPVSTHGLGLPDQDAGKK